VGPCRCRVVLAQTGNLFFLHYIKANFGLPPRPLLQRQCNIPTGNLFFLHYIKANFGLPPRPLLQRQCNIPTGNLAPKGRILCLPFLALKATCYLFSLLAITGVTFPFKLPTQRAFRLPSEQALENIKTMSSNVLMAKDANATLSTQTISLEPDSNPVKPDVMSMEYHRQVFQSKMEKGEYVGPRSVQDSKSSRRR
jgi:hypothetical protein